MTAAVQRATLVPDPHSEQDVIPVLAVRAGRENYGFPLSTVREILMPPPLTEVPRSADHFLGVISVRGEIITLVDLPKMLNLDLDPEDRKPVGRVLLVDNGEELVGVAVDQVIQVTPLKPHEIEYSSTMSAELSEYVVGVSRLSIRKRNVEELLILVDPAALLGGLR